MQEKSASSLDYIKTLSFILRPPGAWPTDAFDGRKQNIFIRIHRATLPFHTTCIIIGGFYHLYHNFNELSFLDMGHMFLTTFLAMLTALRAVLPNLNNFKNLLRIFLQEFHLMHYTHKGAKFKEMNETVDKISSLYTKLSISLMGFGMVMFNTSPTYNNLKNTVFQKTENYSMEYSVYFSYPGFNPLDFFTITTIYNCYLSYNCSTLLSGYDSLLFLMIFQIIGHVFILRYNLENFKRPKKQEVLKLWGTKYSNESCIYDFYDEEENKEVRVLLAESVEHHKIIIGFTDELSEVFGPVLAFNYFFHMIACCLLLLECSKGGTDTLLRYGPLTLIVFGQLIQMSVMFELLGSVTEVLKDSVYCIPWECMDVSNQKTTCIILHKMQYKISVKALGLASVGVNTMTGILKTTFSYYAFLQTMEH